MKPMKKYKPATKTNAKKPIQNICTINPWSDYSKIARKLSFCLLQTLNELSHTNSFFK